MQRKTSILLLLLIFQLYTPFCCAGLYQHWAKMPFETRLLFCAGVIGGGWMYHKLTNLQQQLEQVNAEKEQLKSDIFNLGRDWLNVQDALVQERNTVYLGISKVAHILDSDICDARGDIDRIGTALAGKDYSNILNEYVHGVLNGDNASVLLQVHADLVRKYDDLACSYETLARCYNTLQLKTWSQEVDKKLKEILS